MFGFKLKANKFEQFIRATLCNGKEDQDWLQRWQWEPYITCIACSENISIVENNMNFCEQMMATKSLHNS